MDASETPRIEPDPFARVVYPCPRELVGRLIGRNGVTIKGLQLFTGTVIEIDQKPDPSQVIVLGASAEATRLALSIIQDIVGGNFKGFALLRDVVSASRKGLDLASNFVYAPGIGLLPRRQLYVANSSKSDDGGTTGERDSGRSLKNDQRVCRAAGGQTITTNQSASLHVSSGTQSALQHDPNKQAAGQRAPTVVGHMGELYQLLHHNPLSTPEVASPLVLPDPSTALLGPSSSSLANAAAGGMPAAFSVAQQQQVLLFNEALATLRNSCATTASSASASASTSATDTVAAAAAAAAAVVTGNAPFLRLIMELLNRNCA